MSGLNIKLADLQISDFHAPKCCFQLLGALPPDPYQGLCPWTPLGAYCGPQTPTSFSFFFTFPQSHVWVWMIVLARHLCKTSSGRLYKDTDADCGQCGRGFISKMTATDCLVIVWILISAQNLFVQVVVDFVYTGMLALTVDNVEEVLSAATHLQVSVAVELCSKYLEMAITVDNCVDILNLAELYSLASMCSRARQFILDNFEVG